MKIIIIALFLGGLYYAHTQIMAQIPAVEKATKSSNSSISKQVTKVKQRNVNGMIMLTREELDYISEQIPKRHEKQDFSPIKLTDGTKIPLNWQPNGKICPRTGLPEGNLSLAASIGVMQ